MTQENKPVPTVRESIHAAINSEADVATKANHPENEKIQKVTADHNAAEAQKDKAESRFEPVAKSKPHTEVKDTTVHSASPPDHSTKSYDPVSKHRGLIDKLEEKRKLANMSPGERKLDAYTKKNQGKPYLDDPHFRQEMYNHYMAHPHAIDHKKFPDTDGVDLDSLRDAVYEKHGIDPNPKPKPKPKVIPKPPKNATIRDNLRYAIADARARQSQG